MINFLVERPEFFIAFFVTIAAFALWVLFRGLRDLDDRFADINDVYDVMTSIEDSSKT